MPRLSLIQPRRGTAAEWAAANPVLAAGEMGLETDTNQSKRGDGTTAWTALPYVGKWDSIPGKPAVVAEGATQAAARTAIGTVGATSATAHAPALSMYFPEAEGAVGDGVANDTASLQATLNIPGAVVHLRGSYRITAGLLLPTTLRGIYLAPGSQIIKDYAGNPVFQNTTRTEPLDGLSITGPGMIEVNNPTTNTGIIFKLWANRLHLDDFTVSGASGQLIVVVGDDITIGAIKGINCSTVAHSGVVRFAGGSNFRCIGAHVESVDDTFQFVPLSAGTSWQPTNQSINNALFVGCTGLSTTANFMSAILEEGITSASIANSGWIGCKGYGGKYAVSVYNSSSAGYIDVHSTDCNIDMINGTGTGDADVRVLIGVDAGLGTVRCRHTGLKILNPKGTISSVRLVGGATPIEKVELIDCDLPTPPGVTESITTGNLSRLVMRGGRVRQSPATSGLRLPSGVSNVTVDGVDFVDIPDGGGNYAINIVGASNVHIHGATRFVSAAGAAAGKAVYVQAAASNVTIENTRMGGLATAGTSRVNNAATGTVIRNNEGLSTRTPGLLLADVIDSATEALGVGSLEVGHASDTTITRVSAGRIAVEGNTVGHVLSATADLDFGAVAAQSFVDFTITVTGAVTGDSVALGVPTAAAMVPGIAFSAWVSTANVVTVRAHNYTAGALDPASGTFKASIVR